MAVVDGFYAVPRGGIEIGGVLYGKASRGNLLICDYRKIETEYLTGPSFRLSDNDQAGVWALLTETRFKDPAIRPVGLYVSHTRRGIDVRDTDLEIYNRFFPEAEDVILVLKPDSKGKVRAGYFFRGADGSVKADASVSEFPVDPYWGEQETPPEAAVSAPASPKTEPPVSAPAVNGTQPKSSVAAVGATMSKAAPPVATLPITAPPAPVEQPTTTPEPARIRVPFESAPPVAEEWSLKKQILLPLLVAGSIGAAVAGYWVATH